MPNRSTIVCEIDLEENGKHTGYLRLPFSVHRSAYGFVPIPIVSIRNGAGPRVLLLAGTHGDEYEAQIVLTKLARRWEPESIRGQIVILPMLNYLAAAAGMRTSPIDGGNLNRVFPGDPKGNPTWMIADYVEHDLMSRADYCVDLHSGGSSLMYVPGTQACIAEDPIAQLRVLDMLRAFGAPNAYLLKTPYEGGSLAAARRAGIVGMSAELGGGGSVTRETIALTETGIENLLRHLGIIEGAPDRRETRVMMVNRAVHYVFAYDAGLFEPMVELGDTVKTADIAGFVHFPDAPWREPAAVSFSGEGVVVCKRVPARVERGDCVFHLAIDYHS
jgi:uncharacterized protein